MPISRSQLGIGRSQAKADQVGQPKSGKQILFRINKGGPRTTGRNNKMTWGKDLNTHFRLTPEDEGSAFMFQNGGAAQSTALEEILFDLFGGRPGASDNKLTVRIENLDGVLRMSSGYVTSNNIEAFQLEMMRWSCWKAQAMRRSGDPIDVCILSPNGYDVIMERFGLRSEYYDLGTSKITENTRIVDNTPDSAEDFYEPDGKKVPYGILCYVYSASEKNHVLTQFGHHGYLEFTFSALDNYGIPGVGSFNFSSANDVASIKRAILPVAERCARLGVPLSQIDFELWREVQEVNRPSFDDLSKSLDERRMNGGKKKNGTVKMKITQKSNMLLTNMEFQSGQNQLLLAQRNVGLLSATNSDLYGDDNDTPMLIAANAPIEGEVELEEEEFIGVPVDDGEFYEDEVVESKNAAGWKELLEVVTTLSQSEMLDLFKDVHNVDKNAAFTEMKKYGRSWPRTETKQKEMWTSMNEGYLI